MHSTGSVDLATAFLDVTSALVCVVDRAGRIVLTNPAMQRFTGRTDAELLGRFFWDVYVVPEHVALAQDAVARAMDTGRAYPQEGDWLSRGGERRRVAMQTDVLFDEGGRPRAIACVGFDVTDVRRREEQLSQRADSDLLTGLANRGGLFEALRRHLDPRTGTGCGVLFCDLDRFKQVNDEYGHAVGDRLLVDVAARLRAVAGGVHLVARFGGDEFVLVCPAGDPERLRDLSDVVLEQISRPFPGPVGELSVGVSVGVAVGLPGESPDDLVSRADRAMYGVKYQHDRHRARHRSGPGEETAGRTGGNGQAC